MNEVLCREIQAKAKADGYEMFVVITAPGTDYYAAGRDRQAAHFSLLGKSEPKANILTYLCHEDTWIDNGWLIPPAGHLPVLVDRVAWKKQRTRKMAPEELRQRADFRQQRRAEEAEREDALCQDIPQPEGCDCWKNICASTYWTNLRNEIEYEHALVDAAGDRIKISHISREEAFERNTSLRGSGYYWRRLR